MTASEHHSVQICPAMLMVNRTHEWRANARYPNARAYYCVWCLSEVIGAGADPTTETHRFVAGGVKWTILPGVVPEAEGAE